MDIFSCAGQPDRPDEEWTQEEIDKDWKDYEMNRSAEKKFEKELREEFFGRPLNPTPETDIDYEKAYKNMYTIGGEATKFIKAPKVMTIFRMYFSLNDINELLDERLRDVEELVVVADVVAADADKPVRIPGTRRVVILCRLLVGRGPVGSGRLGRKERKDYADIVVQLSLRQADKKAVSQGLILEERDVHWRINYKAPRFAPGVPTELFAYARSTKFPSSRSDCFCFNQVITNYQAPKRRVFELGPWNLRIRSREYQHLETLSLFTIDGKYGRTYRASSNSEVLEDDLKPSLGVSFNVMDKVPSHLLEDAHVVLGLQATLLSAEAILLYGRKAAGNDAVLGALEHCKWLTTHALAKRDTVKKGSTEGKDEALRAELQSLYVRAQALITLYGSGTPKVLVPPLNYKLYRDSIEQVAVAARLYDDELKATVRQIQSLQTTEVVAGQVTKHVSGVVGGYFMQQFKVLAEKEKDVEVYTGRVVVLQKVELTKAEKHLEKLKISMQVQQTDMEAAKEAMREEQLKEEVKQKTAIVWSIVGAIFQVGLAVVTAGAAAGAAFKAIGKLASLPERFKKIKEVLEKLKKVIEALNKLKELLESNPGQDVSMPTMPEAPTDSDWQIFVNEVVLAVDDIPREAIPSASVFKTKCKNVAAVGREISIVATQVTTLQYQLKLLGWQKEMAAKQRERLDSIKPVELNNSSANISVSSSTLQEMLVQLDMKAMRMTISLIEMLNVQNGALYYNYLQEPEAISMATPTIYNVQQLLIDRDRNSIAWNEMIGKSTAQQRDYKIEDIPVETLLSGDDFRFNILQDGKVFPAAWERVRIRYLELRFTGSNRPTTAKGEIFLVLRGDRVFYDRFKEVEFPYEAAKPLKYPYAYNLDTGATTFDNCDISSEEDNFMRMTPFSRWKLRVPQSAYENDGIRFPANTSTEVTITFHVTVVRKVG